VKNGKFKNQRIRIAYYLTKTPTLETNSFKRLFLYVSKIYFRGRFFGRTSKTLHSYDIKDIRKLFLHVIERKK